MVGPSEFRLSPVGQDHGISCDIRGAFVGAVPLLRRQRDANGQDSWAPRSVAELNAELGQRYGMPVEFSAKAGGLADIANALNRGDVFRAQLAAQQMRLPDPPPPGGAFPVNRDSLAAQLGDSGVLGRGWSDRHSQSFRQGAQGQSGITAPSNPTATAAGDRGRVIKAQELLLPGSVPMEMPLDAPWDWEIPWRAPQPGDFGPMPMNPAGRYEYRRGPGPRQNPYPDDPDCEQEWASAKKQCADWEMDGLFERTPSFGSTLAECVRGLVSVRCGGDSGGA